MLSAIKNKLSGNKNKNSEMTKEAPKASPKSISPSTFGGLTSNQMTQKIKDAASGTLNSSLVQSKVSQDVKTTLDNLNKKEVSIKVVSTASFAEEIATVHSEGQTKQAIGMLREYLNKNKGAVEKRFWYLLMDCYQVNGDKVEFDKVAIAFANLFGTSPPSWFGGNELEQKSFMGGKNIIILEPFFKVEQTLKFKEFFKAAKEEKFCRINVSPCKFEQSEIQAIYKLHQLFTDLRKNKVVSVLMGDNNLVTFCKTYINPNPNNKALKEEFFAHEDIFWLLYLEILQWKNRKDEFENLALDYAIKFEISPPGWDDNGTMTIETITKSHLEEETQDPILDKEIGEHNIKTVLDLIKTKFDNGTVAEIDFSTVERIDFSAAGNISHYIMELWTEPQYENKKILFKNPNEMIVILLEMVGATEFLEIEPRKR